MTPGLLPPPAAQPHGNPEVDVLAAGTHLFRVHSAAHAADSSNLTAQPSVRSGGRFDSVDGSYAYTYLGQERAAAIAETLCRRLPLDGAARLVPRHTLAGRVLSTVELTRDLPVLVLHGASLTQVEAPLNLTESPSRDYLLTRDWARALRQWLPAIAGLRYRCRHDEDLLAYALFDDGPAPAPARARGALRTVPGSSIALEDPAGEDLVVAVLRRHNATLSGPAARSRAGT